jgi:effector-binding domain-containing protein
MGIRRSNLMKSSRIARLPLVAGLLAGLVFAGSALAQTAAPSSATPPAPAVAAPATPQAPTPPAASGAPAASATPATPPASAPAPAPQIVAPVQPLPPPIVVPGQPAAPTEAARPSGDASTAQMLDLPAKPAALFAGRATWDEGFASITGAFKRIGDELAKAGLKPVGKPFAVFLETDDNGFRFEAMSLIEEKPAGKDALGNDVKFGLSPSGKAMKFQHRGAYDDIDSTYEAITAYLDEKNLESRNIFIEEYLTDPKAADDVGLEIDIYVFIK